MLDKRMEHLDSGIRRNDEIRDFYPQIFLKSQKYLLFLAFSLTQPACAQQKDGQQFKVWTARCNTAANQQIGSLTALTVTSKRQGFGWFGTALPRSEPGDREGLVYARG